MTGQLRTTSERILAFVNSFSQEHGYRPTIREIANAVGLKSTSTVHGHLQRLQQHGQLTLSPQKPRSIVPKPDTKRRVPTPMLRRFKVENADGSIDYVVVPALPGLPEACSLNYYANDQGGHTVIRCTECKENGDMLYK